MIFLAHEKLAWNFLKMLPKGYARVDIVDDSYFSNSIKNNERNKRGNSAKVIVSSNIIVIFKLFY